MKAIKNPKEKRSLRYFICLVLPLSILYSLFPFLKHTFSQLQPGYIVIICALLYSLMFFLLRFYMTANRLFQPEKTELDTQNRYTGVDILRCAAISMVITLHYLIAIGYYDEQTGTLHFYILSLLRWFSMCSCPLFMMMSGFLLSHRKVDRRHFLKTGKVFRNYFSLVVIFFALNPDAFSTETIKTYINLDYMWYVNMYLGLALVTPFLNIMYSRLSEREKEILIIILISISSLWTITAHWTTNYWSSLYPIMYYFIGMYIRETEIHLKKNISFFIVCIMVAVMSLYSQYINFGGVFNWIDNYGGFSSGYNAVPVIIASVACFLLLYDIRIKKRLFTRLFSEISAVSLEIYVISGLFTGSFVRRQIWSLNLPIRHEWLLILIVPCELTLGYVCGKTLNLFWDFMYKVWKNFRNLKGKYT